MSDLIRVGFETAKLYDGKALTELDDGTLILEGYVADLNLDREGDTFTDGALGKAITNYMRNPVVIYNHQILPAPQLLGRTLELVHHAGKGLWGKVAIPRPEPGTDRMNHYNDVKSGLLRGFSVGGFFSRVMRGGRKLIDSMDMIELSLTPTPVQPAALGALAGKALADFNPPLSDAIVWADLDARLSEIEATFAALSQR